MPPNRWIFFDLGWTLIDEVDAHIARFRRVAPFLSPDLNLTEEKFLALCCSHGARYAKSPFRAVLQECGLEAVRLHPGMPTYESSLERLYPGVPMMLNELQRNFKLAVIANQSPGALERLSSFGILDFFEFALCSGEVGISKPDVQLFRLAQSQARCSPSNATMVGDRIDNDIGPANALGWKTVRVLQGFSREQEPRSSDEAPDVTIGSISELPGCLRLQECGLTRRSS